MAHQAHALPWNTLASQYKYMMSYHVDPQRHDIFRNVGKDEDNSNKEIDYFCRALAKRVQEFAETERPKFKPQPELRKRAAAWTKDGTRQVYPDEMQKRYFDHEREEHSDLPLGPGRFWQDLRPITKWTECGGIGDHTSHGETVKVMMMEAAGVPPALCAAAERAKLKEEIMESLLLVANHPGIKLQNFMHGELGIRQPVNRIAGEALRVYLYLNLLVVFQEGGSQVCSATRTDEGEEEVPGRRVYMDLKSWQYLLSAVTGGYDGDAQNLVHYEFFYTRGLNEASEHDWEKGDRKWNGEPGSKDVLADMGALKEYLKGVWRILVVYDLVAREAGGDPGLEEMCKTTLSRSFG
ncbi:hypothetical protein PG988_000439 [Apiospora saccharicola]